MRFGLTFILSVFYILGYSQSSRKEFEGRVHYQHTYLIRDESIDSIALVNRIGSASVYTYKKGKFLWTSSLSIFQYEFYDSKTDKVLDKYSDRDTAEVIDVYSKQDSLVSYKIRKNVEVICGYNCDAIEVKLQSVITGKTTSRTIYYSPELYVDYRYFNRYRSYGNNQVYQIIQAVPLRYVTEYEGVPITFIIDAKLVEVVPIDDTVFILK
jgi:hypothetical protein